MPKKGYYLTIDCGTYRLYECLICGQKHAYAISARDCCLELKPAYLQQYALDLIDELAIPPNKICRPRRNYPNIKSPDRWGHRYRGKKHNQRRLDTVYHWAQAFINKTSLNRF